MGRAAARFRSWGRAGSSKRAAGLVPARRGEREEPADQPAFPAATRILLAGMAASGGSSRTIRRLLFLEAPHALAPFQVDLPLARRDRSTGRQRHLIQRELRCTVRI